jgi:DNA-binding MurR/RpiR family transcriptional regulator
MSRLLERKPRLVEMLSRAERIIYYGVALSYGPWAS